MKEGGELVEWVAILVCEDGGDTWELAPDEYKESYKKLAKQILSHPDLALIDRRELPDIPEFEYDDEEYIPYLQRGAINYTKMLTNYYHIIPLAEALKEDLFNEKR